MEEEEQPLLDWIITTLTKMSEFALIFFLCVFGILNQELLDQCRFVHLARASFLYLKIPLFELHMNEHVFPNREIHENERICW